MRQSQIEVVVREGPPLGATLGLVAFWAWEFHAHAAEIVGTVYVAVFGVLIAILFLPRSIEAGSSGVTVRHLGRRNEYFWHSLAAVELDSKAVPRHAYLVRKGDSPPTRIRLPRFDSISPFELVGILEAKRKAANEAA